MGAESDKLEKFSKAVYDEANEKIKGILAEAENSRQKILKQANDESLNIAYDMIQSEIKKISQKYVKKVSKAMLDAKREVISHRDEISTLVFVNVKAQLNTFTLSKNYKDYLIKILKESLVGADTQGGIDIFVAPKDIKFKDILIQACGFEDVTVVEKPSIELGGIEVLFKKSNVIDDKTLDNALLAQKELFNKSASLRIE